MMSNSGPPGMQDITPVGAAAGGGQQQQQQQQVGQGQGQTSHRNVQFRVSAAQQQQLQQHHQQQQLQQQHDSHQQQTPTTPLATDPTTPSSALPPLNASNMLPPQQLQQQHSIGYSQQTSSSQIYQQTQQQQQQRPPIAPTLQPRLHHSASAGNIVMVANSTRNGGGLAAFDASSVGTGVVMPKKKDPYATAWRTYSKIAEELNLLNPDGTLYPISKEAILKYLHHQSKRIKSSNLHWYVNGLKKHQENLGFPWDDVRYDEQVVGLLKELTLHPVMMSENGDEDGHGGPHIYGSQPNRQGQSSSGSMYGGRVGGHYSSSSIDMTQIANLSISQRPHPSLQQQQQQQQQPFMHQQQQMQHKQQQQQQQQSRTQMPYPSINPNQHHFSQHPGSHNQQHHHQQTQHRSQQQFHHQAPPPQKSFYSSAPILMPAHHVRTPSAQELSFQGHTSLSSHGSGPSVDLQHSDSLLTKRKRNEAGVKKRRIPTSASMEGEEIEEIDLQEDEIRDDDDDIEDRRLVGMDDFDDTEEDPNRYQSLKRRASTGTLLNQARASAVKHVPGPYDVHASGSALYQNPASHRRQPSSGERGSSSGLPPHYQTSSSSRSHHHHLRSPSPDLLHDESSSGFGIRDRRGRSIPRVRDSPPESTSSCSSASSQPGHPDELHRRLQQGQVGNRQQQQQQQQQQQSQPRPTHQYRPSDGDQHLHHHHHHHHRHASSSGGSTLTFSPMSGASDGSRPLLPLSATATSSSIPHNPGSIPGSVTAAALAASGTSKNTVQFSEVAEYAQQLQIKYGTRCKDHPWGCVEIASGQHLELTIKMYLDWAGLVASGRLTMDELPDLPEFRIVHSGNVAHSLGGTLRRMASTPFIRSSQPTLLVKTTPTAEGEDSNMTTSSNSGASVEPYRSPSSSPSPVQKLGQDMVTDIADARAGSTSTKDPIKVDSIASLRLMSSPPSHGIGVIAFEKNDPHVDDHANLRKPRKMASTPSFHHLPSAFTVRMPSPSLSSSHLGPLTLHDQQQQQSNIRGRERQQQLQRRSVPTSPRRTAMEELSDDELDGLTDEDEDYDELERDEDDDDEGDPYSPRPASNQYALDPWSTLRRGGGLSNPIRSETKSTSRSKQEEVSITKVETTSTTTTEMDIEHEVAAIGEITVAVDLERRGRTEDEGSAVDAAAQVLDSMKIGRTVTGTTAKDIETSPLISSSIEMRNDKDDPVVVAEEPSQSKISEIAGQESVEEDVVMT